PARCAGGLRGATRRVRRAGGDARRGRRGRARRAPGALACRGAGGAAHARRPWRERLVSALAALAPPAAAVAVRALGATLRLTEAGVEGIEPLWAAGRPLIYATWHARILMIPWLSTRFERRRGGRHVCVLASRSRDGELVARWVRRFGMSVVRGSSSRG